MPGREKDLREGQDEPREELDMFPYYLLLAAVFRPEAYKKYRKEKETQQRSEQNSTKQGPPDAARRAGLGDD